jgi:wyosine [tRNA(Phe)-imidazoG37] synthetase (radical SAM superfamily)
MSEESSRTEAGSRDGPALTFGPVPSRRLGSSLGINNIPPKRCSYSCAYCQVGRTPNTEMEPTAFYSPFAILDAVAQHLESARAAGQQVDYLTFVPDGEPTLDAQLGESIAVLKPLGIPVAVISNGSLCWNDDVRHALNQADWVSVKVDAVTQPIWRRLNRPHEELRLQTVLDGIRRFAGQFGGELATETMLVGGVNDGAKAVEDVADYLVGLEPAVAFLAVPTRPPAEGWVLPASEKAINRAFQILAQRLDSVEYLIGYEGDQFASTGDPERDLLAITSVHPIREDALAHFLERANVGWDLVQRLTAAGELKPVDFAGKRFYVRRLSMS